MKLIFLAVVISLGLTFVNPTTAIANSPIYLFEIFLENKLETFPAWIRSNNLDPSPINPFELKLFTYNLVPRYTFKIKNEQITGYASATNNLSISADVNLKRQFFYISYSTRGSFTFQGQYTINGTNLFPERPLNGEGSWTYAINGTLFENFTYRFNIKPNGYLDISQDVREYTALLIGDLDQKNVQFDGYLQETTDLIEYDKERIKANFQKAFEDQRIQNTYPEHPTASLVHNFLTGVFENTHYLEIINDQPIPTSSSSTTEKPVTNEIPTNPSPTDDSLHGRSSDFKVSFNMLMVATLTKFLQ